MWPNPPGLCWLRPNHKHAWMFAIQIACEQEDPWKCLGHVLPCQNHFLSIVVVLDSLDRCDNQLWSSWRPLQMMTPWCGNKCWSWEPVCGCCWHQPEQLCYSAYWNTRSLESIEKSEEPLVLPKFIVERHIDIGSHNCSRAHWMLQGFASAIVAIDLLREPL